MTDLERKYVAGEGWQTVEASSSSPGAARVLGPFPFAYNTPDIRNGVEFWTPTVGDILLDAWIEIDVAFNGTTPKADIGTFLPADSGFGIFSYCNAAILLTVADSVGLMPSPLLAQTFGTPQTQAPSLISLAAVNYMQNTAAGAPLAYRSVPAKFTSADPMLVVVSRDGVKGGTAVGGSAGSGAVYLVVATPSLT